VARSDVQKQFTRLRQQGFSIVLYAAGDAADGAAYTATATYAAYAAYAASRAARTALAISRGPRTPMVWASSSFPAVCAATRKAHLFSSVSKANYWTARAGLSSGAN